MSESKLVKCSTPGCEAMLIPEARKKGGKVRTICSDCYRDTLRKRPVAPTRQAK